MNWKNLETLDQIEIIQKLSQEKPVIIYKHSTRCSTSHMVLDRLERNWEWEESAPIETYFLDLLAHRDVSNAIAAHFQVPHESPQLIIIKDGKAVEDFSHYEVNFGNISKTLLSD